VTQGQRVLKDLKVIRAQLAFKGLKGTRVVRDRKEILVLRALKALKAILVLKALRVILVPKGCKVLRVRKGHKAIQAQHLPYRDHKERRGHKVLKGPQVHKGHKGPKGRKALRLEQWQILLLVTLLVLLKVGAYTLILKIMFMYMTARRGNKFTLLCGDNL
jgi:hypothetical protein